MLKCTLKKACKKIIDKRQLYMWILAGVRTQIKFLVFIFLEIIFLENIYFYKLEFPNLL